MAAMDVRQIGGNLAPGAGAFLFGEYLRQLGDIFCNPARLVFGKQLRRRSSAGFAFIIDVAQRLPACVTHDETGRREAASGHSASRSRVWVRSGQPPKPPNRGVSYLWTCV